MMDSTQAKLHFKSKITPRRVIQLRTWQVLGLSLSNDTFRSAVLIFPKRVKAQLESEYIVQIIDVYRSQRVSCIASSKDRHEVSPVTKMQVWRSTCLLSQQNSRGRLSAFELVSGRLKENVCTTFTSMSRVALLWNYYEYTWQRSKKLAFSLSSPKLYRRSLQWSKRVRNGERSFEFVC